MNDFIVLVSITLFSFVVWALPYVILAGVIKWMFF